MKTVTIEELLQWAFVHELPKGGGVDGLDNANSAWRMLEANSWGKITAFAELGTTIDRQRDGSNYFIEQGEPDSDAVAVGRAVADLGKMDVVIPAGWNGLADWPETDGLAEAAVRRAVEHYRKRPFQHRAAMIVATVIGQAILGREMDWQAEPSKVRMAERCGKPAWFIVRKAPDSLGQMHDMEVDGFNPKSGRPHKGAYRRFELSTDPTGDILGRLDYQIWVAALRHLETTVAPALVDHRLAANDRSMTPWLDRDRAGVSLVGVRAEAERKKSGVRC